MSYISLACTYAIPAVPYCTVPYCTVPHCIVNLLLPTTKMLTCLQEDHYLVTYVSRRLSSFENVIKSKVNAELIKIDLFNLLLGCVVFNAILCSISVISRRQVYLSMLYWNSLTSTAHSILSKPQAVFPVNKCLNNEMQFFCFLMIHSILSKTTPTRYATSNSQMLSIMYPADGC